MRLLDLPQVLRSAGLTVAERPGWKTRGDSSFGPVKGITCHHTAGSRNSSDSGELGVLEHGSSSAPPPIAQLYLSRSGKWWVVASGLCYHSLVGWDGPNEGLGNKNLIGIEAQHSGGDEPWTPAQYDSYVKGVAALCKAYKIPVSRVAGHKEHQPGAKTDPTFAMGKFRERVAAALKPPAPPKKEEDELPFTEQQMRAFPWQYTGRGIGDNDQTTEGNISTLGVLNFLYGTVKALAERAGMSPEDIASIRTASAEGARIALAESVDEIVAGVLEGLDPDDLTTDAVEAAVRNVLLNGAGRTAEPPA